MLSSSPPVPKSVDGNILATAERSSVVKFCVAVDASRSWPAGGPLAKVAQGEVSKQAMGSGNACAMMEECPGVSISTKTSMPR